MNICQNSDTTRIFYIATCLAKQKKMYIPDRNSRYDFEKTSYNFMTAYLGFERGMTDSGQPCWSEHGPTEFDTLETVNQMVEARISASYSISLIENTVRIYKIVRHSVVTFDLEQQQC